MLRCIIDPEGYKNLLDVANRKREALHGYFVTGSHQ